MSYSVQDSNFHNAESICIKGKFPSVLHPLRWGAGSVSFSSGCWSCDSWPAVFPCPAQTLVPCPSETLPGNKQAAPTGAVKVLQTFQGTTPVRRCWSASCRVKWAGKPPSITASPSEINKHIRNKSSVQKFMGFLAHSGAGNGSSQSLNCSSSLTDEDWVKNEISLVSFS